MFKLCYHTNYRIKRLITLYIYTTTNKHTKLTNIYTKKIKYKPIQYTLSCVEKQNLYIVIMS